MHKSGTTSPAGIIWVIDQPCMLPVLPAGNPPPLRRPSSKLTNDNLTTIAWYVRSSRAGSLFLGSSTSSNAQERPMMHSPLLRMAQVAAVH